MGRLFDCTMRGASILMSQASMEDEQYGLLRKVTKSFSYMHNADASVERSLSDNKNTLSVERTNPNLETLKGLRLAKELVWHSNGAHNIDTLSKDMFLSARNAHKRNKWK